MPRSRIGLKIPATERVPTLYSKAGDAPMASVAGGFSLLSLLGIGRRRAKRGRPSA